jgi:hypothetical protein
MATRPAIVTGGPANITRAAKRGLRSPQASSLGRAEFFLCSGVPYGCCADVRFSNRPVGVKRFQTIHLQRCRCHSRARASLRNRHNRPFHHRIRRRGGTIFRAALPSAGPSGHANSPHPSSREGHYSTAWWSSGFLLFRLISQAAHAAAAFLVQQNSVPSTQMRCMITAKRRASATIARFMPRRLAICIAQALSHDHRFVRSMLWAAS